MTLVGSLMISALVIFPALSSMRLFKSFRSVTIFSVILSVCCAVIGVFIAIMVGRIPIGATIVAVDVAAFIFCWIIGLIKK